MTTTNEIYNTIMPKSKKRIVFILVPIVIALLVIVILFFTRDKDKVIYDTISPIVGNITQTVSATGTLSATNEVDVGSQVSGTIYKLYVDANDAVKQGQVLAEINPNKLKQTLEGYEAQLQSAEANLEASKVTYEQKKWNYEQQSGLYKATNGRSPSLLDLQTAKMEYLSAKADIKVKQASINQIKTNIRTSSIDIENSIITSPINGIVLERSVSVGTTVAASYQTPTLFTIAEDLKSMELVINISESDIGKVRVGQPASFTVDAYPNHVFEASVGKVNFASTTTDNITSYETTIYVKNDALLLRPGMNATASIKVASTTDALLVPVAAIFFNPMQQQKETKSSGLSIGGPPPGAPRRQKAEAVNNVTSDTGNIWVLDNGKPKKIDIKVGISDSKMVEIQSRELSPDSKIIIGQRAL